MKELEQLESNERHSLRYTTDLHQSKGFANFGYEFQQLYRRFFQCGQDLSLDNRSQRTRRKFKRRNQRYTAK